MPRSITTLEQAHHANDIDKLLKRIEDLEVINRKLKKQNESLKERVRIKMID
jgi:hypothetical protein